MDDNQLPEFFRPLRGLLGSSTAISHVGSPLKDFLDIERHQGFQFSFFDSKPNTFELEAFANMFPTPTSETLSSNPSDIMRELETLQLQITKINKRLNKRLKSFREQEEQNAYLREKTENKNKNPLVIMERSMLSEVNCFCSKGCEIF